MQFINLFVSWFMFIPHMVLRRSLLDEIVPEPTHNLLHLVFFKYHFLICFILVDIQIIAMVHNLIKYQNFAYQVKSFGKSFLLSVILSFCGSCYMYSIFLGLFWFLFCVLAVAINDAAAYFVGVAIGKTPLIKLSPKKTVEGFVGGVFGSFLICFIIAS